MFMGEDEWNKLVEKMKKLQEKNKEKKLETK